MSKLHDDYKDHEECLALVRQVLLASKRLQHHLDHEKGASDKLTTKLVSERDAIRALWKKLRPEGEMLDMQTLELVQMDAWNELNNPLQPEPDEPVEGANND